MMMLWIDRYEFGARRTTPAAERLVIVLASPGPGRLASRFRPAGHLAAGEAAVSVSSTSPARSFCNGGAGTVPAALTGTPHATPADAVPTVPATTVPAAPAGAEPAA